MQLFDFPDPTTSVDQRTNTNVPLQGLFFLNSDLVANSAELVAKRVAANGGDDTAKIQRAYRLLFARPAKASELKLGLDFLGAAGGWPQYAQVLLSSGAFYYVN